MNTLSAKYGTEERQKKLLVMIKDLDTLLSKHNIEYSLCGGSLLGAIRENGFIPWDDDIDIMMDRNNYDKIVNLFSKQNEDNRNYIMNRELWIDRLQRRDDYNEGMDAATIDIFVMDHCPDNNMVSKLKVLFIRVLQGMMKQKPCKGNYSFWYEICLWLTYFMGKPFSMDLKYHWYKQVSQIGNRKETKFVTGYNDYFNLVTLRYSGKLLKKIIRHQFEDTMLPITAEYNNYLTTQYGDYMTPPPMEERISLHS